MLQIVGKVYMGLSGLLLVLNSLQIFRMRHFVDRDEIEKIVDELAEGNPFHMPKENMVDFMVQTQNSKWIDLHVVPVLLWVVLSFVQTSDSVRAKMLTWHKLSGYLMLFSSVSMMLGVFLMIGAREKLLGTNGYSFENIFSFTNASIVFGMWWMYCIVQAYRTASSKTKQLHRYYALHFLACGYGVATMRWMFFIYCLMSFPAGGSVVPTPEAFRRSYDYTLWAGFTINMLVMELYLRNTSTTVTQPKLSKRKTI